MRLKADGIEYGGSVGGGGAHTGGEEADMKPGISDRWCRCSKCDLGAACPEFNPEQNLQGDFRQRSRFLSPAPAFALSLI